MRDDIASNTAFRVAVRRAEHQVLDHPVVFDDPVSLRIIGPDAAAGIQPGKINRRQRLSPSFRAYMAARSRFTEDHLALAVAAGVRQYVILGAGLDTFGYRSRHVSDGLHVFEVDHPATQAWKREMLETAAITVPDTTTLVPANLEHATLAEVLRSTTFRLDEPAFFSWLGVTPYLSDSAFEQTLAFIAALPAPTAAVFDYAVPREGLNPVQQMAFDKLAVRVADLGEPFHLFLDPMSLAARLSSLGFSRIADLGAEELNQEYFADRTDGLRVKSRLARLAMAVIAKTADQPTAG